MRLDVKRVLVCLVGMTLAISAQALFAAEPQPPIRLGIIGVDTIHAVAFSEIIEGDYSGGKEYRRGLHDWASSREESFMVGGTFCSHFDSWDEAFSSRKKKIKHKKTKFKLVDTVSWS